MKNIYKFTTQTKQYIMLYKNAMNFTQIYLTNEFPECFAQYQMVLGNNKIQYMYERIV